MAATEKVRAEIVSADSIQIFTGLDIGSAKPTPADQAKVPHHLIDIIEPEAEYSVHQWRCAAEAAITDIRARGGVPIVVGGTHLYVKALLDGLFEGPGADEVLRAELRAMEAGARRAELERVDPRAAARIHPNDERRTIRALEVFRLTGRAISEHQGQWDSGSRAGVGADAVLIGLEWEPEAINRRINDRVREMVQHGLVDEAWGLWEAGRFGPQSRESLGYKQLIAHFEGRGTLAEAIETIKIETRRFAKNQRTWMRRLRANPGGQWINAAEVPEALWARTVSDALRRPEEGP